jgi:hypothetical protein
MDAIKTQQMPLPKPSGVCHPSSPPCSLSLSLACLPLDLTAGFGKQRQGRPRTPTCPARLQRATRTAGRRTILTCLDRPPQVRLRLSATESRRSLPCLIGCRLHT